MTGRVRTKRWNDPVDADDGTRILVCRYRPRALPKKDETWSEWQKELGPSAELHAAVYGKDGAPLPWAQFTKRYRITARSSLRWIWKAVAPLSARTVRNSALVKLICPSKRPPPTCPHH